MTIAAYKETFSGAMTCRLTHAQVEKMRATKANRDTANKRHQHVIAARRDAAAAEGPPLQCMLCSFTSHGSLITHVTRKHSVTMSEYRSRFPTAVVQRTNKEQRQKLSSLMQRKLQDPCEREAFMQWRSFPSEMKHWIRKGLDPREAAEKVAEHQRRAAAGQDNPATKARQSTRVMGAANPMSLESIASRHGVSIDDAHALTPCYGRTGSAHPMFGQKHTEEALAKIAASKHLAYFEQRSSGERDLEDVCQQIGRCAHNVGVKHWNVDVMFDERKLIVEYFGDYWHMNPRRYAADSVHNLTKKTAQEIWDRDARKLNDLRVAGYDVVVVWEADWRADEAAQLQRIKDAYDRAR